MSTRFHIYSVDLNHFYSLIGSKRQDVIDAAFAYLEKGFQYWDNDVQDKVIKLSKIYLNNLIINGFVTRCKPDWYVSPFNTPEENEQSDIEHGALRNAFRALLSLSPSFDFCGEIRIKSVMLILKDAEIIAYDNSRELSQLFHLLSNGRPLYGEQLYHDDNYYTYLHNAEIPYIIQQLGFYHNQAGQERLTTIIKQESYAYLDEEQLLTVVESLEIIFRNSYMEGADLFAHVA